MDKYAIYLRKSRADEEAEKLGEGETLARHLGGCGENGVATTRRKSIIIVGQRG